MGILTASTHASIRRYRPTRRWTAQGRSGAAGIETDFGQRVLPEEGLDRLEHQRLLDTRWGISDNNRRAKYYSLTPAGRKRLRDETASWQRLVAAMGSPLAARPEEA
jgi:hypothetical protein